MFLPSGEERNIVVKYISSSGPSVKFRGNRSPVYLGVCKGEVPGSKVES